MALGCAFIFVMFLWLWRRHARKKRAKRTAVFASRLDQRAVWRRRFAKFAEMFKHGKNKARVKDSEQAKLMKLREAEAMRHAHEMKKIESAYAKSLSNIGSGASARDGKLSRQPSIAGSYHSGALRATSPLQHNVNLNVNTNRISAPSLYSQFTGQPRSGPDPKQPTRELDLDMNLIDLERGDRLLSSRFSTTTAATSIHPPQPEDLPPIPALSEAEAYAAAHAHRPVITHIIPPPPQPQQAPSYWIVPAETIVPVHTGESTTSSNGDNTLLGSRNPFRHMG